MKKCSRCKLDKDITQFSKNKLKKDGYSHSCKECQSVYRKQSYQNNIEYYKEESKKRKKKVIKEFNDFKSTLSCKNCGENHIATLDFHHRNASEKEGSISSMLHNCSMSKIKLEIEKCDVLCSNCHRILHFELKNKMVH